MYLLLDLWKVTDIFVKPMTRRRIDEHSASGKWKNRTRVVNVWSYSSHILVVELQWMYSFRNNLWRTRGKVPEPRGAERSWSKRPAIMTGTNQHWIDNKSVNAFKLWYVSQRCPDFNLPLKIIKIIQCFVEKGIGIEHHSVPSARMAAENTAVI